MPYDPTQCAVLLAEIQVLQAELNDLYAQKQALDSQIISKLAVLGAKQAAYNMNCTMP